MLFRSKILTTKTHNTASNMSHFDPAVYPHVANPSDEPHPLKAQPVNPNISTVHDPHSGAVTGVPQAQGVSSHLTRTSGLLQTIKNDHREIEAFYDQAIANVGNKDGFTRWCNQFVWQVARHSASEEISIYPELGKHLGEAGQRMADSDRADHQYVKDRLKMMESMETMSEGHVTMLKDVMSKLREHMRDEEENEFPKLEAVLSDAESTTIAKAFEKTKGIVPTHPHPSAPSRPPFESIAGFFATPIDKLKDMVAKFPPVEERNRVAEAAKAVN